MVNDLVSIVTCFNARLYGARGGRKLKQTIVQTIETLDYRQRFIESLERGETYQVELLKRDGLQ